nr:restriction endonuclease subunit S [Weissella koreensis]
MNDWEERKLSDFSKTTYGGGTPKTAVTEYWDGNIPWIQSSNLTVDDVQEVNLDKFITDDAIKNSAAKLIPANSIAIVTRVGVGKLTLMKQEFATSQDFLSLSELHVDEQFGLYSIYKLLQKELNNIQGTSIKGMTKADLLTKDIMIPVEKDEQIKIGSFLKQLDHLITLHQRKLDLLKEQKKGYLQKMFPKNGAKVPELRFAGFADDWEDRKLGEVINYIKGFAFKSKDYKKKGIRIIRVSDLSSDKITESKDSIFVSNKDLDIYEKYKINHEEIIITTVGSKAYMKDSAVGRPIIIREKETYLLNQNLVKITSINNYNNNFIYYQLLQPKYSNYISTIERGNANQANIAINDLWEYTLLIPKIEEQEKIGSFFKQLDNTIALHQRQIDLLKLSKKGLLQKMFV